MTPPDPGQLPGAAVAATTPLAGFEDLGSGLGADSNLAFIGKVLALSLAASYLVKYGELFLGVPFDDSRAPAAALACIAAPTALNVAKWSSRSRDPESDAFGMF